MDYRIYNENNNNNITPSLILVKYCGVSIYFSILLLLLLLLLFSFVKLIVLKINKFWWKLRFTVGMNYFHYGIVIHWLPCIWRTEKKSKLCELSHFTFRCGTYGWFHFYFETCSSHIFVFCREHVYTWNKGEETDRYIYI